jgi:hypothetical protein
MNDHEHAEGQRAEATPADDQRPTELASRITYDTKPKRRLFEVLKAHGMAANQQVTFLTDGGEDIRDIPCYLTVQAEHLLDWFDHGHGQHGEISAPTAPRPRC